MPNSLKSKLSKLRYKRQISDEEYRELTEKLNGHDKELLDKIRAEIHATAELHEDGSYYLRDEWIDEIIDKYKAERSDKE